MLRKTGILESQPEHFLYEAVRLLSLLVFEQRLELRCLFLELDLMSLEVMSHLVVLKWVGEEMEEETFSSASLRLLLLPVR